MKMKEKKEERREKKIRGGKTKRREGNGKVYPCTPPA